jgi:hypothetical protein
MSEAKVTLAHKKSLRDGEAKKPALLARLKAVTGVDYEFSVEPNIDEVLVKLIVASQNNSNDHANIGEALYGDNGYLATAVKL